MRKFTLLAALLAGGMAHAFAGTPRHEWIGRSVADTGLPHAGKPTVYVFTQPDCAPCSLQLGALSALQRANPRLQVTVVTEQNSAALREYLGGFALDPVVFPDTAGDSIRTLALRTIPAALFVNAAGRIEGFYEGTLTNAETRELGTVLLANQPLPRLTVPGGVGSPAAALPGVNWASSRNHLLIFHSANCVFCVEQLPHLLKFAGENPNVAVWVIAPDRPEVLAEQFTGAPANLKFVTDPENPNLTTQLAQSYRVQGTPTQILVSGQGVIAWRGAGFEATTANPFLAGRLPLE